MNPYVSIIITAYNEENKIKDTLLGIVDIQEINEIIVVDDGSSDNTENAAKSIVNDKIKVFKLDKNRGKGYALNYGLKKAMENADIIGFLDGDLGSSSSETIKLIKPVINNEVDVTIAKFPPAKKKGGMGFVKRLAKELNIVVIGLSQLSRKKASIEDMTVLKGSSQLENDASQIIILSNDEAEEFSNTVVRVNANINKNRNGKLGKYELIFNKPIQKFVDKEAMMGGKK